MDGKIKISYRLILATFFIILSNISNSNESYSPGDVVLIALNQSFNNSDFYYMNNLVTTVIKNDRPYLLFGIPYNTKHGTNNFKFSSDNAIKKITLEVMAKEYPVQNIQIDKYKTKTNKELKRILNEKKEIINAKKNTYKVHPDFNFIMPAEGTVTGVYGTQRYYNGKKGNFHNGHDIAGDSGTPVYAPSSGKVVLTGDYYYNGKFIMINHGNNLISMFLHLNDIFIAQDQIVKKGEIIGTIGSTGLSTGPHLHWSVLLNNAYINPLALVNN
jgi:murein DD-endopeptidase MepM/ murein hydrolase activator NlpD